MKKFLIKLSIFAAIVVAIDIAYGKACSYMLENAKGGDTFLHNTIANEVTSDVLIFGSSKAKNQYDPRILQDTLNLSVFNCGEHGMGILYNYGLWKVISKRYVPKVLVYEFLPILDIMTRDDNSIYINPLRRYYGKVEGIDSLFWSVDENERYKMCASTYRYHNCTGFIGDYLHAGNRYILGYSQPADNQGIKGDKGIAYPTYVVDSLKLYYLEKFIQEASPKTKLIFVTSPMYSFHSDYGGLTKLKQLCSQNNIPMLDHFSDKEFVDSPELYIDMAHLNRKGSIKWSSKIASELKQHIN